MKILSFRRWLGGALMLAALSAVAQAQSVYRAPDSFDWRSERPVDAPQGRADWAGGATTWDEPYFDAPQQNRPVDGQYRWRELSGRNRPPPPQWREGGFDDRRGSPAYGDGDRGREGYRFRDAPELGRPQGEDEHRFRPYNARDGAPPYGWGENYRENSSGEYPDPSPVFRPWADGERNRRVVIPESRFDDGYAYPDGQSYEEPWRSGSEYGDPRRDW